MQRLQKIVTDVDGSRPAVSRETARKCLGHPSVGQATRRRLCGETRDRLRWKNAAGPLDSPDREVC